MNEQSSAPSSPLRSRRGLGLALAATVVLGLLAIGSCRSTVANRDPLGERLPQVQGKSLDGASLSLPLSEASVLLVGYAQDAQFDADRWLIGLLQAPPPARILEVPTIRGLFPRLLAGRIDSGMRGGIPSEDWQSVLTLYGEAAGRIVEFTGNERPSNMRVLLLDAQGRVRWFHDRGFSASKLLELGQAAARLSSVDAD